MSPFENCINKARVFPRNASARKRIRAALSFTTALVAAALAAPVSAAKTPPIPTLTNTAIDFGLGAGAGQYSPVIGQYPTFTGQSTGVVTDPKTGNFYYSNYLGDVWAITPSTDAATAKDVTIDPDYAVVYAETPKSSYVASVITSVASQCQNFGQVNALGIDTVTQNVFVPCGGENKVFIINEATNNIVASIPVPHPWGAAADETTGTLYVASTAPTNTISVISEKTNTVTATIPVGNDSEYLAVDSKNKQLFVGNYGAATLSVIDIKKGSPTLNTVKATIPLGGAAGLALDSKTDKLYVSDYFNTPNSTVKWGSVYVIDAKSLNIITNIPTPAGCNPLSAAADSAHGTVYVLCYGQNFTNGTIGLVIDEKTDTIAGTFNTLPNPLSIALNPNTGQLLVGTNTAQMFGSVSIYNTNQ